MGQANDFQEPQSIQKSQTLHHLHKDPGGSNKRKFTSDEDQRLSALVDQYGPNKWFLISQLMPNRNPRQCRERWANYLQPYLKTGSWTANEDQLLEEKFAAYGTKWNKISKFFVHRSPLTLRNRHMVLSRRRRKAETHSNETVVVVPPHKNGKSPPTGSHLSTPFSDEELKLLYEDIFA
jgi:hypothetical protein